MEVKNFEFAWKNLLKFCLIVIIFYLIIEYLPDIIRAM